MELYYGLLKRYGRAVAERYYERFLPSAMEFTDDVVKNSAHFRWANASKNFSYIDCLGYVFAAKLGVPFVTGDSEFKDMPNVEFVK